MWTENKLVIYWPISDNCHELYEWMYRDRGLRSSCWPKLPSLVGEAMMSSLWTIIDKYWINGQRNQQLPLYVWFKKSITKLASRSISVGSIRENRTSRRSFSTPSMTQDNRCSHTLSSGDTQEEWELNIERSLFFSVLRTVSYIKTGRLSERPYLS